MGTGGDRRGKDQVGGGGMKSVGAITETGELLVGSVEGNAVQ